MLQQKIADLTPQQAGATAVLTLPPGPTYDGIYLKAAGATATLARLKNPRLEINGVPVLNLIGLACDELNLNNKFHGYDAAIAGPPVELYIPFRRSEIKGGGPFSELQAERLTSLRTRNAGVVQFKVDIDAAYVDAPGNLTAEAVIAPGIVEDLGLMLFTRVFTVTLASGFNVYNLLPRVGRIKAIHAIWGDITELSLIRNNVRLVDRASKTGLQRIQNQDARQPDRAVDNTRTVINFCSNGNLDEAVSVSQADPQNPCTSLELDLTSTAGGAGTIVVEYLARLGEF